MTTPDSPTTSTPTPEPVPSAGPNCAPVAGSEVPKFELYEYNPRRRARGVEAAHVMVTWPDAGRELLWMTPKDIRENMREFGDSPGLSEALQAYADNVRRDPQNTEVRDGGSAPFSVPTR